MNLAIILIFIFLLLNLKIYIDIRCVFYESNNEISIKLMFFYKLIKIPIKVTKKEKVQKKKIKKEKKIKDINDLINALEKIQESIDKYLLLSKKILKWSKKTFIVDKIYCKIDIGTDDAAHTGIITGALWGIMYGLLSTLNILFSIKKQDVDINPVFDKETLSINCSGIIGARLVNIIIMSIALGIHYIKEFLISKDNSSKDNINNKGGVLK